MHFASAFLSYSFACIWGILILLSFIGWGAMLNRLLFPAVRMEWGLRAGWGIAFSIAVGGVLNLFWLISPPLLTVYILAGAACWLAETRPVIRAFFREPIWRGKTLYTLAPVVLNLLLIATLLLFLYASEFHKTNYNNHDDFHGYLNLPLKMIQTGSMGPDPFSEVRLVTSLGGQYFLHAMVLTALGIENIYLMDLSIGLVVLTGLLIGFGRGHRIAPGWVAFAVLFFLIVPAHMFTVGRANTTGCIIPLALFVSLCRTLERPELSQRRPFANAFMIALIISAICTIKTSLFPAAGLLFAFSYFFLLLKDRWHRARVLEAGLAGVLIGVLLLPWMISLYQSSGTFLFPVLGKGCFGEVYGTNLDPLNEEKTRGFFYHGVRIMAEPDCIALLVLSAASLLCRPWRLISREPVLSLTLAAVIGALYTTQATTGTGGTRYIFPFVYAVIPLLLLAPFMRDAELAAPSPASTPKPALKGAAGKSWPWGFILLRVPAMGVAIATACIMFRINFSDSLRVYAGLLSNLEQSVTAYPDLVTLTEREAYKKMQATVAPGVPILVRLEKPFLMDFKRNRVFILGNTWGTSPAPGLPFFKGPQPVEQYLKGQKIRYLAYSYANEAAHSANSFKVRLGPEWSPLVRVLTAYTIDSQHNFSLLGATHKHVFDDGDKFMLDLEAPR